MYHVSCSSPTIRQSLNLFPPLEGESIPWEVIVPVTASVSVFASVDAVFAMKWGYAWSAIYADAKKAAERRFSWLTIYSRSNSVAGRGNSGSVQDSNSHPPATTTAEIANSTVEMPEQDLELSNGGLNTIAETTECSHVSSDYVPISELLK